MYILTTPHTFSSLACTYSLSLLPLLASSSFSLSHPHLSLSLSVSRSLSLSLSMASSLCISKNPSSFSQQIPLSKHKQFPLGKHAMSTRNSAPTTQRSIKASVSVMEPVAAPEGSTSPLLANMWREIQGSNNWEDLVEPLDPLLRNEIIRYGELVNACYKAFDINPSSKRYLNCKYGKKSVMREVGMEDCGYRVTKYIYATPDISIPTQNGTCCSRWIGYVAVSTDDEVRRLGRRDIIVTFRGTITNTEWIANFMSSLTPARLDPNDQRPDVKVESGFLSLYTSDDSTCKFGNGSCREQLLSEVSRLINQYKDEEVSITMAGHSMGSSLGLLLAYDIAELGLNRNESMEEIPITVFSFGGPRVGNSGFKERCEELGVKVLRIVNVNDPITKLPGVFLNENFRVLGGGYELPWSCSCYAHVGVEIALDYFTVQNPSCVHDLDAYIGILKNPERVPVESGAPDLLHMAREFLSAQKLDTWPWEYAARNVGNLVQSLRT